MNSLLKNLFKISSSTRHKILKMMLLKKQELGLNQISLAKIRRMYTYSYLGTQSKYKTFYDFDYLCDELNKQEIEENIKNRKQIGNINKVIDLWKDFQNSQNSDQKDLLLDQLNKEACLIPNKSSPHLVNYGQTPKLIKYVNEKPKFKFKPGDFQSLAEKHYMLKTGDSRLSLFLGPRSYYFSGALVDMEQALIRYTISHLLKKGFKLMSVPDILYENVIQRCGMETKGTISKVFHISNQGSPICLSGTAEMAIGGFLQDKEFELSELPLKFVAVSRCYRQETGELAQEKGIYRVHAFTKVEMFGVTASETGEESFDLYKQLVDTQVELFSPLGFHFQILDMPMCDLGAPAFTKTDIEAWMPVQQFYGEISSASNCTDYQSRRLNIRYRDKEGCLKFAHTVNGTACAIPRCLMATVASNQLNKGEILVPEVLQKHMDGLKRILPSSNPLPTAIFKGQAYDGTIVNRESHFLETGK